MKKCLICGVLFDPNPANVKKGYGKYCSTKCCGLSKIGIPAWNKGLKGFRAGKTHHWFGRNMTGKNNPVYKGDKVGYRGLHLWVETILGKPTKCEFCGKDNLVGRQIHWANKSRKYLRNRSDWLRLCVKCHKTYDQKAIVIQ